MATTRKYLNHLLQNTGITPACSEEEREAAEDIAQIFVNHGFEPEIQEFSASGSTKIVTAVLGIVLFVGTLFLILGGVFAIIGLLLVLAAAVLFWMERTGRPVLSNLGAGGLSQNVIAYHKASGPLASPRNRPVVVVAHYDSPRADILSNMPYAAYKPMLVKLLPYAMLVPAVVAVLRLFPLPEVAKIVLWIVALITALIPLINAIAIILNRFVLPYTSGSVCNKSSVAAMLGVMDAVSPFHGKKEFPHDMPFEKYFAEQRRIQRQIYAQAQAEAEEQARRKASAEGEGAARGARALKEKLAAKAASVQETVQQKAKDVRSAAQDVAAGAAGAAAAAGAGAAVAGAEATAEEIADTSDAAATELGGTVSMPAVLPADATIQTKALDAEEAPVDQTAIHEVLTQETSAMSQEEIQAAIQAAGAVAQTADAAGDVELEEDAPQEEPAEVAEPAGAYDEGTAEESEADDAFAGLDIIPEVDDEQDADAGESGAADETMEPEGAVAPEPAAEPEPGIVNAAGNYRFGGDVIRSLGMLAPSCAIEYEPDAMPVAPVPEVKADVEIDDAMTVEPEVETDEPYVDADEIEIETDEPHEELPVEDDEAIEIDESEDDVEIETEGEFDPTLYDEEFDEGIDEEGYDYAEDEYYDEYGQQALDPSSDYSQANGGFMESLSAFGTRASRFFDNALARGKSALENIEAAARDAVASMRQEPEELEDEVVDEQPAADGEMVAPSDELAAEPATEFSGESETEPDHDETPASPEELEADVEDEASEAPAAEEEPADSEAHAEEEPEHEEEPIDPGATVATNMASVLAGVDADASGATQAFDMSTMKPVAADDLGATVAQQPVSPAPKSPAETVDSLMAEISAHNPKPAAPRQVPLVVPDPSQPSLHQPTSVNRASLFDLPDPLADARDPLSSDVTAAAPRVTAPEVTSNGFTVISSPAAPEAAPETDGVFETLHADDAPSLDAERPRRRGLGGLFRRKKRDESSMSDWLGVDDDFDAKRSGRDIGSWDNFEDDDWKGGAASSEGASIEQMRDAITSLGDDELLGHDIWFVATGASEFDNAGIRAFLETHRDKLRGVFLINLECVGAGQIAMVASEGEKRVLKGDKRIMGLVRKVSAAFHNEYGAIDMPYVTTDAYAAMSMSLRSLTLAGIDGPTFACSHSEEDLPYNVDVNNINMVADVVTEVIRRS